MFFFITHAILSNNTKDSKTKPKFITQFIIGCCCYTILFLLMVATIPDQTINKFKYFIIALLIVDLAYLIYISKAEENAVIKKIDNNSSEGSSSTVNIPHAFLLSDSDDFKIGHHLQTPLFESTDDSDMPSLIPDYTESELSIEPLSD